MHIVTHDALTRGQTVADVLPRWPYPPNAKVLMEIQAERLADMFTTRVLGYAALA